MKKKRINKRAELAKRLKIVKERHADHKYIENILKREARDGDYHEIRIKHHNQIVCFYCGQRATGVDHQPPISCIEEYESICKVKGKEVRLLKVSCCGECNRLLGNSLFSSLAVRLEVLRTRLLKKYKKLGPLDKASEGTLRRRLMFDRGINRIKGRYE